VRAHSPSIPRPLSGFHFALCVPTLSACIVRDSVMQLLAVTTSVLIMFVPKFYQVLYGLQHSFYSPSHTGMAAVLGGGSNGGVVALRPFETVPEEPKTKGPAPYQPDPPPISRASSKGSEPRASGIARSGARAVGSRNTSSAVGAGLKLPPASLLSSLPESVPTSLTSSVPIPAAAALNAPAAPAPSDASAAPAITVQPVSAADDKQQPDPKVAEAGGRDSPPPPPPPLPLEAPRVVAMSTSASLASGLVSAALDTALRAASYSTAPSSTSASASATAAVTTRGSASAPVSGSISSLHGAPLSPDAESSLRGVLSLPAAGTFHTLHVFVCFGVLIWCVYSQTALGTRWIQV
jgi:hypothetical protein